MRNHKIYRILFNLKSIVSNNKGVSTYHPKGVNKNYHAVLVKLAVPKKQIIN